jgi:predicted RNase H-like HicB family nuclease
MRRRGISSHWEQPDMTGFGRCPSPCRGERRRHLVLAGPAGWPCRLGADQRADPCGLLVWENWSGTRVIHVPYVVEQDEDGVWCASAQLRPEVGAVGDGPTAEAAVDDLRDALEVLLAEAGRSPHHRHCPG